MTTNIANADILWLSQVKDAQGELLLPSLSKVCPKCKGLGRFEQSIPDGYGGWETKSHPCKCHESRILLPVNGGDILEAMDKAGWTYDGDNIYDYHRYRFWKTHPDHTINVVGVADGKEYTPTVALAARRAIEAQQKGSR